MTIDTVQLIALAIPVALLVKALLMSSGYMKMKGDK
jgi:hypothetical protein